MSTTTPPAPAAPPVIRADPTLRRLIRRCAASVAILTVSVSAPGCGSMQPGGSAPPPLPTGVRASHVERTYVVRGTTGDEILRSLYDTRISAPGGAFQGLHSWRMRWSYRYAPAGGVCRMQSVEVQLQSETLVPRWEDRERADSAVAAWWDGYIGRLRAHENQHRAIAYQGAREVHRQLKRATSPTCGTMPARADELARRILNRYQARNEAYDEATQHGRTEGLARPDPPGRTDPPGAS